MRRVWPRVGLLPGGCQQHRKLRDLAAETSASTGEGLAVRRETQNNRMKARSLKAENLLSSPDVPEAYRAVVSASDQGFAVRREGYRYDCLLVPGEKSQKSTSGDFP